MSGNVNSQYFYNISAAKESKTFDPKSDAMELKYPSTPNVSSMRNFQLATEIVGGNINPNQAHHDTSRPILPPRVQYTAATAPFEPKAMTDKLVRGPQHTHDCQNDYCVDIPTKLQPRIQGKEKIPSTSNQETITMKPRADISSMKETVTTVLSESNEREGHASDEERIEIYFSPTAPAVCGNLYENADILSKHSIVSLPNTHHSSVPIPAPRSATSTPTHHNRSNHYTNESFS